MSVEDIYRILDGISPFELQESWDNSGLLVGDWKQDVNQVVLSIDLDEELEKLDIDSLTPLEALNKLYELQRKAKEG